VEYTYRKILEAIRYCKRLKLENEAESWWIRDELNFFLNLKEEAKKNKPVE